MIAAILCLAAFLITIWAGKRSLSLGLQAVFTIGYLYGILRANLPTAASHFLFDASLLGFYLSQKWAPKTSEVERRASVQMWCTILIAWPCLLSLVPFQNMLVTLVGLRGNIFFLPLMLFGSRLRNKDLSALAYVVALLNLAALGIGLLEYTVGIERFFPRNEVTAIIYASQDVSGGAFRIPATFLDAHAYAGAMVMSLPLLFGAWAQRDERHLRRQVYILGIVGALLGVLLSATRLHFVVAVTLVLIALLTGKLSISKWAISTTAIALLVMLALGNERLQRFTTLNDSKMIDSRVTGSFNSSFWDILHDYPLGNGLGGGGTSMPYFLQNQVRNPIGMENEFARILSEQGAIGLLLWAMFIIWYMFNWTAFQADAWRGGRILAWFACVIYFGTGVLGMGLLTAIPQTAMLLLLVGWAATKPLAEIRDYRPLPIPATPIRRPLTSTFSP